MKAPIFTRLINNQAVKFADKIALYDRNELSDPWKGISWKEFSSKVDIVAKAFLSLGIKERDRVGQFSQNKNENFIVDFALFSIRGVNVPIYPTSSLEQVKFIVNDAEIQYLFVGEKEQYNIALELFGIAKTLKKIIVFDKNVELRDTEKSMYFDDFMNLGKKPDFDGELEKRRSEAEEKDMAAILYTSGTTGNPKGVIIIHEMYNEAMRTHTIRLSNITQNDVSIAFLPLTHVFERTWCYYLIYVGSTIYINHRPTEIQQTIKDVRPTLMCAVPRFWEKVFVGVQENLEKSSPLKLAIVAWAVATGKKYNLDYLRRGKKPDIFLTARYKIADKLIFSKVKNVLGLENANMLPAAGAKLADSIAMFFISIGIPIVYGYGLTESTATVSHFILNNYKIGTVGTVMPDLQIKIGEDNEILLKGKTITPGYYNNPEANKNAFTADGWFRTGDAGSVSKDGKITLMERIKDLFKTSNGKYIAPQEIETRLELDKYIEQAATIGDERNYVTAIIVPSIPALEEYAKENKISYGSIDELLKNPKIYSLIQERIALQQKGMANYELIKKFTLIKKGFTIETGELTNTLKLRRAVIMQKYKDVIDAMYEKSAFIF
ncbi:putative long-chain-fatty-acid--CoA ligase [uncultured Paludibacter sp.]|nr:putative long-chain-fatty-acid--CoA ligase [uncultured Paludibacter sp.]